MKIKGLRNIKSLFQEAVPSVEVTIKIDLAFIKQLADILAAELNKLGFPVEAKSCVTIVTKMLDDYMKKRRNQDSKMLDDYMKKRRNQDSKD